MEKIASFTVNHLVLEPGIYVSRQDHFNDVTITTFDLRMTTPNKEPVMNTAEMHTIEHLGATYLRNHMMWRDRIVYFLCEGDLTSRDIVPLVKGLFEFIRDFEGVIPGAEARDCGNYLDQNLPMAKYLANRYLENTIKEIDEAHLVYAE